MKPIIKISKQTKIILIGIFIIMTISFLVAYIYYNNKNESEDPRIVHAKIQLKNFDELMKEKKYSSALILLDSIEKTFKEVPGYSESYEPGIIYNNRASVYLSMALYQVKDSVEKVKLLEKAKINADTSIFIYSRWMDEFKNLKGEDIKVKIIKFFPETDPAFNGKNYRKILKKRVEDIQLAQNETPRRISVAYTNLGIAQRHLYCQPEAIESYIKAIKLWKDNFTARNNFNVLMGKQPEDRSIIDQLFPPEKNKFN